MNKRTLIYLLWGLLLTACAGMDTQGLVTYGTAYASETAEIRYTATPTITPSPTIDYQSTLVIAQATADEARRLNTQATAEFEQRQQVQLQMTAESDRIAYDVQMITATMAGTSIPLTQTQQSVINTQIPAQQTLQAGILTATHEAPTLMVAMSRAQNEATYGALGYAVNVFAVFGLTIFIIVLSIFLYRMSLKQTAPEKVFVDRMPPDIHPIPDPEPRPDTILQRTYQSQPETIVTLRTDHGGGFARTERMVIPCRPDQFTELCEGVISGVRSLAINVWEGAQQPFTRGEFMRVREWMQRYQFAQSAGAGSMILTAEGETLFRTWLESHALPGSFKFEEVGE